MVTSQPKYIRKAGVVATSMDGEIVMMDIDQGKYFGIAGVGQVVWNMLSEPCDVDALAVQICAEYDVDAATARSDVEKFLAQLTARQLVEKV